MGAFTDAAEGLVNRMQTALGEAAVDIMRKSLVLCPISGPDTYDTYYRTIREQRVRFEYPKPEGDGLYGDNGTLRRSARVFAPERHGDTLSVLMGYGFGEEVNPEGRIAANYAVIVHEVLSHRHNPPTQAKYLEVPLMEWAGTAGEFFKAELETTALNPFQPLGVEIFAGDEVA